MLPNWQSQDSCRRVVGEDLLALRIKCVFRGAVDVNEGPPWEFEMRGQSPVSLHRSALGPASMHVSGCSALSAGKHSCHAYRQSHEVALAAVGGAFDIAEALTLSLLLTSASAKSGISVRENNTILGSIKKGTSSCRFCLHLCRPAVSIIHHNQICISAQGMGIVLHY